MTIEVRRGLGKGPIIEVDVLPKKHQKIKFQDEQLPYTFRVREVYDPQTEMNPNDHYLVTVDIVSDRA